MTDEFEGIQSLANRSWARNADKVSWLRGIHKDGGCLGAMVVKKTAETQTWTHSLTYLLSKIHSLIFWGLGFGKFGILEIRVTLGDPSGKFFLSAVHWTPARARRPCWRGNCGAIIRNWGAVRGNWRAGFKNWSSIFRNWSSNFAAGMRLVGPGIELQFSKNVNQLLSTKLPSGLTQHQITWIATLCPA